MEILREVRENKPDPKWGYPSCIESLATMDALDS